MPVIGHGYDDNVGAPAFRNRIINGGMVLDQRNNGAAFTITNGTYPADRFVAYASPGTLTAQRLSNDGPAGVSTHSIKITNGTAPTISSGSYHEIGQLIEGYNVADFNLGTANAASFTFSFWVKASITGNFPIAFRNLVANRSYVSSYTINTINTWERKTVIVSGETTGTWAKDNTAGMVIYWALGDGSNYNATNLNTWENGNFTTHSSLTRLVSTTGATWQLSGVQLEKGNIATPFEFELFETTLRKCQRYYYRTTSTVAYTPFGWGSSINTSTAYILLPLPTTMRIPPTGIETSAAGNFQVLWSGGVAPSALGFQAASNNIAWINATSSATFVGGNLGVLLRDNNSIGSYIGFTGAEL